MARAFAPLWGAPGGRRTFGLRLPPEDRPIPGKASPHAKMRLRRFSFRGMAGLPGSDIPGFAGHRPAFHGGFRVSRWRFSTAGPMPANLPVGRDLADSVQPKNQFMCGNARGAATSPSPATTRRANGSATAQQNSNAAADLWRFGFCLLVHPYVRLLWERKPWPAPPTRPVVVRPSSMISTLSAGAAASTPFDHQGLCCPKSPAPRSTKAASRRISKRQGPACRDTGSPSPGFRFNSRSSARRFSFAIKPVSTKKLRFAAALSGLLLALIASRISP